MKTFKIYFAVLLLIMTGNFMGFDWGSNKTLKELSNLAPYIVVGKVLDVTYQNERYLEQNDFIYTYVRLNIQTTLKGDKLPQIITLKIPGGQIGNRAIRDEFNFQFLKDEKALLF